MYDGVSMLFLNLGLRLPFRAIWRDVAGASSGRRGVGEKASEDRTMVVSPKSASFRDFAVDCFVMLL